MQCLAFLVSYVVAEILIISLNTPVQILMKCDSQNSEFSFILPFFIGDHTTFAVLHHKIT